MSCHFALPRDVKNNTRAHSTRRSFVLLCSVSASEFILSVNQLQGFSWSGVNWVYLCYGHETHDACMIDICTTNISTNSNHSLLSSFYWILCWPGAHRIPDLVMISLGIFFKISRYVILLKYESTVFHLCHSCMKMPLNFDCLDLHNDRCYNLGNPIPQVTQ